MWILLELQEHVFHFSLESKARFGKLLTITQFSLNHKCIENLRNFWEVSTLDTSLRIWELVLKLKVIYIGAVSRNNLKPYKIINKTKLTWNSGFFPDRVKSLKESVHSLNFFKIETEKPVSRAKRSTRVILIALFIMNICVAWNLKPQRICLLSFHRKFNCLRI